MAALPTSARPEAAAKGAHTGPLERKGDEPGVAPASRRDDRRAASGCLWDACEALLASLSDPQALPQALDSLRAAFDCDGVALHALSPEGGLEPWCARGEWQSVPGDLRECIGMPLFRGRERVGALDLRARKGQRWTPDQLALVRTASGALGAALGARLELERLRRAPGRDPVTGLADARAFHARLVEEEARSQRTGQPLAVIALDLDHFAALNERYGRECGDQVLAEVALVLKVALREGDLLTRLAGDEFAVVLPDCDLAPARRLAERLRHAVEEHRFARAGKLSCSAGVAASPRDGLDSTELLASAEEALGLAKKAGRRRTAQHDAGHSH